MSSTGEIKNAVRLAQQYNINIYKILMNGLGNSSLRVSQLRVELEEYNRSSMKFFDRLYQIRDSKIPFACVKEEQIRVFRDQVKRNDKLRQEVHSIQRNLWNMREMGQRLPLANKHLIEQRYPELCVKYRSDRVPLTVLCDHVNRKYNLRHERHIIALLKWAEEESNSRKATNSVSKRNLQRNQIHPTLKPTLSQDQLAFQALAAAYAVTPVNSNEDISKDSADGFDITLDDITELDSKSQTKKRGSATCAYTNKVENESTTNNINDCNSLKNEENAALDQENLSINFKRPYPLFSWEELMMGFNRSPNAQIVENISQPSKTKPVAESTKKSTEELGSTYTGISSESNTRDLSLRTERQPCDQIQNLSNQPMNQKIKHVCVSTERKQCDKTSNLSGTTNTQKTQCLSIKTARSHENKDLSIQPNIQKSQGLTVTTERKLCDPIKSLPYKPNTQKSQSLPVTTERRHCDTIKSLPYKPNTQKSQRLPVTTERRHCDTIMSVPYKPKTQKSQSLPVTIERKICETINSLPYKPNAQKSQGLPVTTEKRHCDTIKTLPYKPNTQESQGVPVNMEKRHAHTIKNLPYPPNTWKTPGLPFKSERKHSDKVKILPFPQYTWKTQGLSTTTKNKHCDGIKSLTTEKIMEPPVIVKSDSQKSQNTIKPVHPLVGSDRPHVYENKIKRTQHSLKRTFTERMTCTEADQLKKRREEQLKALELKKERMKELLSHQFEKPKSTKSSFHYYKIQDNVPKVRNGSKKSVTVAQTQGHRSNVAKVTKDTMSPSLVSRKRKASHCDILPQSKRTKVSKLESGIVLKNVKETSDWNDKQVFDRD